MSAAAKRPVITPADRLSLTFCLAIICHAVIVLGVTFSSEDLLKPRYSTMDIVLVQQRSQHQDEAKLLAQASLEGGGESEEEVSPSTPLPPPFPDNQPEVAAPPPANKPQPATEASKEASPEAKTTPVSSEERLAIVAETATLNSSPDKQASKDTPSPEKASKARPQQKQVRAQPSATDLLANSLKIAALSARVDRNLLAKSQRPKRKFISASTREYKYAAYMEAWRAKVERVGNLNYPEEARKRKLSGSLVLDVSLNPDGSINMITVRHPSGHKVLDDAAIRIVKLAAPFAPFPDAINGETDILHIIRTWQFLKKGGFQ